MACDEIRVEWSTDYILVSFGVAFLGSYVAVSLVEHFRVSAFTQSHAWLQFYHLLLIAFSIGGDAVWCMHFIGMGAMNLIAPSDRIIHPHYDLILTIISLVCSVSFVYVGAYVATLDKLYTKERHELFEELIKSCSHLTVGKIRSKWAVLRVVMFHGTSYIMIGGLIAGGGVCIMHYVGMVAMFGPMTIQWNYGIIAASVLIACVAATAAFWIMFRMLALYPQNEKIRMVSAVVMAIAIFGMHYTGMSAATYCYDTDESDHSLTGTELHLGSAMTPVIVGALIFNWMMIMLILSHSRRQFYILRSDLRTAKMTIRELCNSELYPAAQSEVPSLDTAMVTPHTRSITTINKGAKVHAFSDSSFKQLQIHEYCSSSN
mmetsp:Transcript_9561/g.14389  ORF Transcript_9561/g.14389 Transcript_9561/m.14389 type:complete len:375 (-) Transcript_9561:105-1229(-)